MTASAKTLYRWGGISAITLGMAYILTIGLFAYAGAPPSDGGAWLKYLAGKTAVWSVILVLSILTDLLYFPITLALYVALQSVNRNLLLGAAAFVGLFMVLDLAVTWTNYGALIHLSTSYANSTSETQRQTYVAAANYAAAVLASPLEIFDSIVTLSIGILLVGIVMLGSNFNKVAAYIALATGATGLAALSQVSAVVILNALLATVWVFVVGYSLVRLAGSRPLRRGNLERAMGIEPT